MPKLKFQHKMEAVAPVEVIRYVFLLMHTVMSYNINIYMALWTEVHMQNNNLERLIS